MVRRHGPRPGPARRAMSRPSILARLVPLVPVLGAMTLATNAYLTRQLARNGEAIAEETRLVGVLTRADAADSDSGTSRTGSPTSR